jgi:3-deoxy-D-manno-octulosonate 8-phosphate phosphatase KdsC-like HAD superfamily phosphatase
VTAGQALGSEAEAWLRLGSDLPAGVVRVVLADVDGVVTPGEGHPARLSVLQRLTDINAAALTDPLLPAVTLCTGRQAPYVEVMAQMTGAFLPCSFEHGAGLFFPRAFRYVFHPRLGDDHFAQVARVLQALDLRGRAFVQPGKEAMITLFPLAETPLEAIAEDARAAVRRLGLDFTVEMNVTGVEVRPRGIDKGEGCRWLASLLGLRLDRFGGVGDSEPDLAYLSLPDLGFSACPRNAVPKVRAAVSYVSQSEDGEGLLEILAKVEEMNRACRPR